MITDVQKTIISQAARKENTPELQSYWEKRYTELYNKELFQLSTNSEKSLQTKSEITQPVTTFGDIIIKNHIKEDGNIDEELLQGTIESAVRFLDSLLDIVPLSKEARLLVDGFRKIGLGVADFNDFIDKNKKLTRIEAVDLLGHLVAGLSYRASESLAEEKGSPLKWESLKKILKAKPFEYWYNTETGEIKNGLEMCEDFNQQNISGSPFEIVPRRNSNLLLFPPQQEWLIWSDRDLNVVKKEEKELQPPTQVIAKKEELTPEKPAIIETVEQKNDSEANVFQVGELVKIINNTVSEEGNVYQVVDIDETDKGLEYQLTGGTGIIEEKLWSEKDLEPVDLATILEKVNQKTLTSQITLATTPEPKPTILPLVSALIFNKTGNAILIDNTDNAINLPHIILGKNQSPERTLSGYFKEKYNLDMRILQDLGSCVSEEMDDKPSNLYLIFLAEIKQIDSQSKLNWVPLENNNNLPMYVKVALHKKSKLDKIGQGYITQINILKDQLSAKSQELTVLDLPSKQEITPKTHTIMPENTHSLLSLTQKIISDSLGDVTFTADYNAQGVHTIALTGSSINTSDQYVLGRFLELINLCLQHNISIKTLTEYLQAKENAPHTELNQLLEIIITCLNDTPTTVDDITSQTLIKFSQPKRISSSNQPATNEKNEQKDTQATLPHITNSPETESSTAITPTNEPKKSLIPNPPKELYNPFLKRKS